MLLAGLACASPAASDLGAPTVAGPSTEFGSPIVVCLRWKSWMIHRSVWVSGDDEAAGSRWDELPVEESGPGAEWVRRDDACAARWAELSEAAYERFQAAGGVSLLEDDYTREHALEWHLLLPSADVERAVVMHWRDVKAGIVVLDDGSTKPLHEPIVEQPRRRSLQVRIGSWSVDGRRVALALDGAHDDRRELLVIVDAATGATELSLPIEHDLIAGLAWNDDGKRLAILAKDTWLGTGPIESLYKQLGHGRPYSNYFVAILDLVSGSLRESALGRDLPEAQATILWAPDAVGSVAGPLRRR